MNYIELIRNFWRCNEIHSFSVTEIALYFHLLEICNICSWENPFRRNNAKICADLNITLNPLKNARNKLKQMGLINFEAKQGNPNVKYILMLPTARSSKYDEATTEVVAEDSTNWQHTKDKQKLNPKRKEEPTFSLDFIAYELPQFVPLVEEWMRYKSELGKPFKIPSAVTAFYNRLKQLSKCDVLLARQILDQSISQQYESIFELKTQKHANKPPASHQPSNSADERKAEILRRAREAIG